MIIVILGAAKYFIIKANCDKLGIIRLVYFMTMARRDTLCAANIKNELSDKKVLSNTLLFSIKYDNIPMIEAEPTNVKMSRSVTNSLVLFPYVKTIPIRRGNAMHVKNSRCFLKNKVKSILLIEK